MLDSMSPEDLIRWREFHRIEPFWWEQILWAIAELTAVVDNRLPGPPRKGKTGKSFFKEWWKSLPIVGGRRPAPPPQDPHEVHRMMVQMFGPPPRGAKPKE